MSSLDSTTLEVFANYAVNKHLVQDQEIGRLPRFIAEYLIAKFTDMDNRTDPDLKKLSDFVNIHYPELKDRDKVLHDLMTSGTYTLMDEFKVETDIKRGRHRLIIPSLNVRDAQIISTILDENTDLLRGGMWGIATLKYLPQEEEGTYGIVDVSSGRASNNNDAPSPILMSKFTPFQVTNVDLHEFAARRRRFSREEWVDLLIRSIGLNPGAYDEQQKLLVLCRLVPLVESNYNLMELGPKATGKTYLYRNVSYYTRVISGGRVSPATLFYNISLKTVGEIGVKDCVVFDEVSKLTFYNSEEMIGKLKDYMVDGFFERGPKKANAKCSLVFMGNVDLGGESGAAVEGKRKKKGMPSAGNPGDYDDDDDNNNNNNDDVGRKSNDVSAETFSSNFYNDSIGVTLRVGSDSIISSLPRFMHDSALLDRIHAFIPGWELPKIRQSSQHLATGYGIVADYLSEILHQLSMQNYGGIVSDNVRLEGDVTIRDEKAIKKTASGLLKLICPDRTYDDSDLQLAMDTAVSGREMVNSLLNAISPEEFDRKRFAYAIV